MAEERRTGGLACAARTLFHHRAASRRLGGEIDSARIWCRRFENERAGAKVVRWAAAAVAVGGAESVEAARVAEVVARVEGAWAGG